MRVTRAVGILVAAPLLTCGPSAAKGGRACSDPPAPNEISHHEFRLASTVDTAYARRGVAPLVFRIRAAWPPNAGKPISARIALHDTLTPHLPPLGSSSHSAESTVIEVPLGYTAVRVESIVYANHTVPLVVRPGYPDTITVALARTVVCLAH